MTKSELLPGDILLYIPKFKNGSLISLFIAKSENDIESHAGIWTGAIGEVFESLNNGPQFNLLEDSIRDAKNVSVYRYKGVVKPTEQHLLDIIEREKLDHLKYNWFNLVSQLIYIKTKLYIGTKKNKNAIICSVLVAKIWNIFNPLVCQKYWLYTPSGWSNEIDFQFVGFIK